MADEGQTADGPNSTFQPRVPVEVEVRAPIEPSCDEPKVPSYPPFDADAIDKVNWGFDVAATYQENPDEFVNSAPPAPAGQFFDEEFRVWEYQHEPEHGGPPLPLIEDSVLRKAQR